MIDMFSQTFSVNCRLPLIEVAGSAGEEDTLFTLMKVQFQISNQDKVHVFGLREETGKHT